MKGKGKGIGDSKDCPLQFPDLKPVDHSKSCPLYSSVLTRTQEEGIGGDEIDRLQTELETLLASAGKRLQLLQKEIQTLNNWQDKKEKKPAPGKVENNSVVKNKNETLKNFPGRPRSRWRNEASDVPVVKRGKGGSGGEDKPNKKFKDSNGKATHCSGPGRPKNKNSQVKMPDYEISESSDIARSQKNDIVNRFWASVDPYCAEISSEDMKVLEEVLVTIKDDSEFFKIPPLGKHYSERWAQEDIMDEQKEGGKISDKRRSNNSSAATNSNESSSLLKKSETCSNDDSPFGPLTQRLVTALIEEHVMAPVDDTTTDINTKDLEDPPTISPKMLAKQLNISNAVQLEKRIKKELEEQGILDFDEKVEDNPDDEILSELRRKQEELKAINLENTIMTKRLIKLAKEEMESQKLKKKLAALDAELLEAYRKVQSARLKKRQPTKKEKDAVWKILHDREDILKQIDG
ncbi:transcriptional adapter 3-like isoform X2 [Argonauta hians]